ncbi:hypothetical protein IP84_16940 [beta proteobacterium AAP99]|nr:hypothetical protein IP84_16940 [beta proteobacterium AAP99]
MSLALAQLVAQAQAYESIPVSLLHRERVRMERDEQVRSDLRKVLTDDYQSATRLAAQLGRKKARVTEMLEQMAEAGAVRRADMKTFVGYAR